MARTREYLDLYKSWTFTGTEAEFGTGLTLAVKFAETKRGDPATIADIGSLTKTATASGGSYTITFTPSDFADLAGYVNKAVIAHIYDNAGWRDAIEYVATDTDPDLLDPLR